MYSFFIYFYYGFKQDLLDEVVICSWSQLLVLLNYCIKLKIESYIIAFIHNFIKLKLYKQVVFKP